MRFAPRPSYRDFVVVVLLHLLHLQASQRHPHQLLLSNTNLPVLLCCCFAYTVGTPFSCRSIRYRPDPQSWAALATQFCRCFFSLPSVAKIAGIFRFFSTLKSNLQTAPATPGTSSKHFFTLNCCYIGITVCSPPVVVVIANTPSQSTTCLPHNSSKNLKRRSSNTYNRLSPPHWPVCRLPPHPRRQP